MTQTRHSTQLSIPQLARSVGATGSTAVADWTRDWTRNAATSVRRHRSEMLILAGTLAFALLVLLLSLATAF